MIDQAKLDTMFAEGQNAALRVFERWCRNVTGDGPSPVVTLNDNGDMVVRIVTRGWTIDCHPVQTPDGFVVVRHAVFRRQWRSHHQYLTHTGDDPLSGVVTALQGAVIGVMCMASFAEEPP